MTTRDYAPPSHQRTARAVRERKGGASGDCALSLSTAAPTDGARGVQGEEIALITRLSAVPEDSSLGPLGRARLASGSRAPLVTPPVVASEHAASRTESWPGLLIANSSGLEQPAFCCRDSSRPRSPAGTAAGPPRATYVSVYARSPACSLCTDCHVSHAARSPRSSASFAARSSVVASAAATRVSCGDCGSCTAAHCAAWAAAAAATRRGEPVTKTLKSMYLHAQKGRGVIEDHAGI